LIKGRDKDEIGFAVARAGFGAGARHEAALAGRDLDATETNLEATYRYVVKDWLNIQPDVQYVLDPHGRARTPNALVVGLRLAFTYSK
jgi:porin